MYFRVPLTFDDTTDTIHKKKTMTYYLEEHLDMPISKCLLIMQARTMNRTNYFGVSTLKNPIDSWIYQEIFYETQPDVIIEIGNASGGSTLFWAHMCELIGKGRVIGLDLSHEHVPDHVKLNPRITFIEGDACQNFNTVRGLISDKERVLIIEDSSHTYDNTLNLLRLYSPLVKIGDYFIVEDSICHHGLPEGPKPGPYEAIETFMDENEEFEIDRSRESFLITWNPKGYLKRKRFSSEHPQTTTIAPSTEREWTIKSFAIRIIELFTPPIIIKIIKKIIS